MTCAIRLAMFDSTLANFFSFLPSDNIRLRKLEHTPTLSHFHTQRGALVIAKGEEEIIHALQMQTCLKIAH